MSEVGEFRLPEAQRLDSEEFLQLLNRAHSGDLGARDQLIQANLRLVGAIASRFRQSGADPDDLFQVGCLGLVKAIDRFDTSHQVQFSTYAVPLIMGEIRRFLREDRPFRVARSMRQLGQEAKRLREEIFKETGMEPTLTELAGRLGVEAGELVIAWEAVSQPTSLSEVIYQSDGQPLTLEDQLGVGSEENPTVDRLGLQAVLAELPERERQIILLRYFEERTQAQTAEKVGVSQVHVSRLEKKALQALRAVLGE